MGLHKDRKKEGRPGIDIGFSKENQCYMRWNTFWDY